MWATSCSTLSTLGARWQQICARLGGSQSSFTQKRGCFGILLTCLFEELRKRKQTLEKIVDNDLSTVWDVNWEQIGEGVKTLGYFETDLHVAFNETLYETEILKEKRAIHLETFLLFLVKQLLWHLLEGSRQTLNDVLVSVSEEEL